MQRYLLCIILGMLLLLTGCSGGDGSSISSNDTRDKGSVAVLLTDGPADGYDHIWIWITEISLLPSDHDDPVVVYQSDDPEGWKVDLLDLRDQEAVVTVNDDIPAGHYRKIRLRIADIRPEGENVPCDYEDMEIKLPGNKIDLKPKGGLDVIPGETIAIHIDIDCNKSINLHPAGRSGKCIFRPVVFVEIDPPDAIKKCPRVLRGKIETLQEGNTGFTLRLGHGRGLLTVLLTDGVVIFGRNGMPAPPAELELNQLVHVRGQLDTAGNLQASDIVIGRVILVKGMVETPYDDDGAVFSLNLMLLRFFTDFIVDIDVSENTLVMTGCDQRVDPSEIQAGMMSRVVGKLSFEDRSIKAIAVVLKDVNVTDPPPDVTNIPTDVIGMLTDVSGPDDEGGYVLLVEGSGSETSEIYLPAGVEPYIENDVPVPIDELQRLTDCDRILEVSIVAVDSNDTTPMIASDVSVDAVNVDGMVEEDPIVEDDGTVVVTLESGVVITEIAVPPTAILTYGPSDPMVPINTDIRKYDYLRVNGLDACEGDEYDYQAYMVSITSP